MYNSHSLPQVTGKYKPSAPRGQGHKPISLPALLDVESRNTATKRIFCFSKNNRLKIKAQTHTPYDSPPSSTHSNRLSPTLVLDIWCCIVLAWVLGSTPKAKQTTLLT